MTHSTDELIEIAHRHYPRGMANEDPRNATTDEHRRLSAARRRAGADNEPWRALLRRAAVQFPGCSPSDRSLHLPTGDHDAGYCGELLLPTARAEHPHTIGFLVSFLAPCYVVYSTRTVDDVETAPHPNAPKVHNFYLGRTMYVLPAGRVSRLLTGAARVVTRLGHLLPRAPVDPILARARARKKLPPTRREIHLDLSPEEQPYAAWLAREIEATWGCARMPEEIGNIIVPDVATNLRGLGEARLYDCLLSDDW
jgi:hypothetical protein